MSGALGDAGPAGELLGRVRDRIAAEGGALTADAVARALRAEGRPVGDATVLAIHDTLRRDVEGAGPLEPLLALDGVTDILVNGAEQVWIDRGEGLERTGLRFPDDHAVRRLAQRLAATVGRRLDDAAPFADLRLPSGVRFHAVLAPIAMPGTVLSLRIPGQRSFGLAELEDAGSVGRSGRALLESLVAARAAFLVTGGTGSGKTTLLGALLAAVPAGERIVLVEDSRELRPAHPHVVGLEARPANIEGAGEIAMRSLVRQALRMRPDRLVVGEVRGAEVVELLAAMNTGHEGGCGTVHANSAGDLPARIESLCAAAGLAQGAAHSQLASAVEAVIHVDRGADRRRRVREIAVLSRQGERCAALSAVRFDEARRAIAGPGMAQLERVLAR